MKARQRLFDGSFDPDTLKAACQAFDEAWESIAKNYSDNPLTVERARLRLANAVLAVAPRCGTDVEALRTAALQHVALNYRDRCDGSPVG